MEALLPQTNHSLMYKTQKYHTRGSLVNMNQRVNEIWRGIESVVSKESPLSKTFSFLAICSPQVFSLTLNQLTLVKLKLNQYRKYQIPTI